MMSVQIELHRFFDLHFDAGYHLLVFVVSGSLSRPLSFLLSCKATLGQLGFFHILQALVFKGPVPFSVTLRRIRCPDTRPKVSSLDSLVYSSP